MEEEVLHVTASLPDPPLLAMMPQGLHNDPPLLRRTLQEKVRQLEDEHPLEAIILGYGLCSRGIEGVSASRAKLVVPRAHDCITLLLGSRKRYSEYVQLHPATYWYSVGWNRHHLPPGPERVRRMRDEYAAKYGEDNADFLMEEEQAWVSTYDRATFIDTGVGPAEQEAASTEANAKWLGWNYDRQPGSLELIRALVEGPWPDSDFLVLEPGRSAKMTADEGVIARAD